ncbi:hypothetical protein VTI74DRAFT_1064 [Chaetomium olivicolor]
MSPGIQGLAGIMASPVQGSQLMATMEEQSPLAFVFKGNEMIVQCTANTDDEPGALRVLDIALRNYQNFNDGKHAAIVRCKGSTQYWITGVPFAQSLDKDAYRIVKSTMDAAASVQAPVTPQPNTCDRVTKIHIRRPRNQFIIRQWMSAKFHAENPGVTAGCISRIVDWDPWKRWRPGVAQRSVCMRPLLRWEGGGKMRSHNTA